DNGTPYLLTGGNMGTEVEVSTLEELESYLGDNDEPLIVKLNSQIKNDRLAEISIASNKTFIGTENASLENVQISISGVRNVIVKDLTFSKVRSADAIEINGDATNIWIDHCELFSDREHDDEEDYYDGLLDIKNESSFITVSWCNFHDHRKGILIASGDDSDQDSIQRITFHHNYFHNVGSRLPSIRFGKAHVFNNYYKDCETAINTRMNACVRVEKNYFQDVGTGVGMLYSPIPGSVELIDNIFESSGYSDEPTCELDVPYEYSSFLDNAEDLPTLILANIREVEIDTPDMIFNNENFNYQFDCYPNPSNGKITIAFDMPENNDITITLFDLLGHQIGVIKNEKIRMGANKIEFNTTDLKPGIYLVQLSSGNKLLNKRLIIQ
ncbi:T9SS type A sorting domain-containing protein, partial [Bacteroidota bacterium]